MGLTVKLNAISLQTLNTVKKGGLFELKDRLYMRVSLSTSSASTFGHKIRVVNLGTGQVYALLSSTHVSKVEKCELHYTVKGRFDSGCA